MNPGISTPTLYTLDDLISGLGLTGLPSNYRRAANDSLSEVPDVTSSILEGARNTTLTSIGGSMRARGVSVEGIQAALLIVNQQRCEPPLTDLEVASISQSVATYQPGMAAQILHDLNDVGNAKRLAAKFGTKIRYVHDKGQWLIWENGRWIVDQTGGMIEIAKAVARSIFDEAANAPTEPLQKLLAVHASKSNNINRLLAMIKLTESIPEIVIQSSDLDKDPMILGVQNGALNLQTLQIRTQVPEDYITANAPVSFDINAQCPQFLKFLNEITGGDQHLQEFLQKIFGYCLTGDTSLQALFFLWGGGANGKSTFLNIMRDVLGDVLSKQCPSNTLMSQYGGHTNTSDIARLASTRLVVASEIEEGSYFDETLIKQLTGGEAVTSRQMYKSFFEYIPKYKILIGGNHKPRIMGSDDGIWRRFYLVPFTVTIPEAQRDPLLAEKLKAELPGILNWALLGGVALRRNGLLPPKAVTDACLEYRSEMDPIGDWLTDECRVDPAFSEPLRVLYDNYKQWAYKNGLNCLGVRKFSEKLQTRFKKSRLNTGVILTGLKLK